LEANFSCFAKIIWMPSWFAKLLELLLILRFANLVIIVLITLINMILILLLTCGHACIIIGAYN
jgi:hypothetical protein